MDTSVREDFTIDTAYVSVVLTNADATTNGLTVDARGQESLTFVVNHGISGDTLSGSLYWNHILEESVDNSTWTLVGAASGSTAVYGASNTAVPTTGIFATVDAAAEDPECFSVTLTGIKSRYYRHSVQGVGTHTNGTPIGSIYILGARNKPVANT